ncbi:glycosyltransferase family 4 protein [Methylothermus subterraneus]
MKIAVVAPSPVPFVFGGAERFWLDLVRALNEQTPHEAELLKIPFPERDFWEVVAGYLRFFELDLSAFDCVISTKYPAWMAAHPRHIVYLQHKLRGLYDAYPRHLPTAWPKARPLEALARLVAEPHPTPSHAAEAFDLLAQLKTQAEPSWFAFPGPVARGVVHFFDRVALRPQAIWRYAAISQTVARRADYFPPEVEVRIAHHPSGLKVEELPFPDRPVVFTASRLDGPKRVGLIVRAFSQLKHPEARLRIAGVGPQEAELRRLAAQDPRIEFLGRLADAELAKAYGQAQAVVFVPEQEDWGLVALEAAMAGRPVITCRDAGGVLELIEDGVSGLVVEPDQAALAAAMAELLAHPERARALGEAARQRAAEVSWAGVLETLGLAAAPAACFSRRPAKARPIVVLAPFSLRPPRFGGANRIFHLYRAWSRQVPVHILSLGARSVQVRLAPNLLIDEVATTAEFARHAGAWSTRLQVSAHDVALLDGMDWLPEYRAWVHERVAAASLVVVSHPYCLPALPRAGLPPLLYDAHNVEYDLKAQLWSQAEAPARERALALVREAEAEALERAAAVLTVCQEEAERFASLYGVAKPWIAAPNGVDLPQRPFLPQAAKLKLRRRLGVDSPLVAFVGSWHGPNLAALDTVLAVAKALPGLTFALAGSLCAHPKLERAPRNVAALGKLSDAELAVLLGAAEVGLNPVTQGAGTNLKVLDYAACGAVILSTPFGVRGLPFRHAQEAWLSAPDELANALKALLADASLRERLARAARQQAENFNWEKIGERAVQQLVSVGVWREDRPGP